MAGLEKLKNIKVLVVDDIPMMRVFVVKTLTDLGIKNIIEAEDGQVALDELENCKEDSCFDIIISDVNMPILSGLELLEQVRASENSSIKDLPFLIVTTATENFKVIKASELGVTNYIVKPYTPDQLKSKILDIFNITDRIS